jgi:ABC-type Mn2+/Zn2+ transport system permease subunit
MNEFDDDVIHDALPGIAFAFWLSLGPWLLLAYAAWRLVVR